MAIGAILFAGFFPIARVNSSWVLAKDLDRTMQIADYYYRAIQQAYGLKDPEEKPTKEDLQAEVLTSLIEDQLISEGVRRETGNNYEEVFQSRLAEQLNDEELLQAGMALYGLSYDDFVREVLSPSVRADILESRLYVNSSTLDDWLRSEKGRADIQIFSSSYFWNGDLVEAGKK